MLQAVGYEVGEINTVFDQEMQDAVKKFQADNELEVTGELTGESTDLLMNLLREKIMNDDPQLEKAVEVVNDLLKK